MSMRTALVTGAAGFIGSHLVDRLHAQGYTVLGVDNLIRGLRRNLVEADKHPGFRLLEEDLTQYPRCLEAVRAAAPGPIEILWHMAANSDIAAGVADPEVDLKHTFLTTHNSLRLARELKIPRFAFASSSAVYGDHPSVLTEDTGPLFPISNYGAMKLASEGLISAALESFLEQVWIFRFPNVVGSRATHGIIYDLIHKLKRTRAELEVLGDGSQSKPYLHVSELLDAMLLAREGATQPLNYFNVGVAGQDDATTVRTIAEKVLAVVSPETPIRFTGGKKGWTGDVPKFRYSTAKLQALGWKPQLTSDQAIERAVREIAAELLS
jgi:UDP-glucose 4-epimerase